MALTVRLNPKTERTLNALSRRLRQSRSDVVREALAHYGAAEGNVPGSPRPYDAWLDVIGVIDQGARRQGRTTGEQFTDIVRRKIRVRRSR